MADYTIYLSQDPKYRLAEFFYVIGDETNNPKLVEYSDFDQGGIYFFLRKCKPYIPIEIWYLIFEHKFVMEKDDYMKFLFDCHSLKPSEYEDFNTFYEPVNVGTLVNNDHDDTKILSQFPEGRDHIPYNTLLRFLKFISRWFIWLREISEWYFFDKKDYNKNITYFKENLDKAEQWKNVYFQIFGKINHFYSETVENQNHYCCKNKTK